MLKRKGLLTVIGLVLLSGVAFAAGSKISDLPSGSPLVGTDNIPMQRGSGNVKGSMADVKTFVLNGIDTDDVSEGSTNLYYTQSRVDARVAVGIAGIDASAFKPTEALCYAISDETSFLTTGTAKITARAPYAFTITGIRGSLSTAPTGSSVIIDVNEGGTTILSTKLYIDATTKTSVGASTTAVISDTSLADDAEITMDIDQIGSGNPGAGAKVCLIGHRT